MGMGVDKMSDPVSILFGLLQYSVGFKGRVNEGTGIGSSITNQVTERGHLGQSNLFYVHLGRFAIGVAAS